MFLPPHPNSGAVERNGKLAIAKVPDVKSKTLIPFVSGKVDRSATVHTDELASYKPLSKSGYKHKTVHHNLKLYVIDDAHTNTIDGFWSLLKRGINGVYHSVSPQHLQGYLNEYSFRYNHREDEIPMFETMLHRVSRHQQDGE